jgi:hypothetical protein
MFLSLLSVFLISCVGSSHHKYSHTTYFTSFDISAKSAGKSGRKFKLSFEQYNADSNLIYEELYANPNNSVDFWGKLLDRTKYYYNGKQKVKAEREFGIAFRPSEHGKVAYSYEWKDGLLAKWLVDGKPAEEYQYDKQKNQVEKRAINGLNVAEYYRFYYSDILKTKSQYFVADTLVRVDTFLYDTNKRLIETYTYNYKGEKTAHRVIIRNSKGQAVEEKWREGYEVWRMHDNGEVIQDEFYQANKYYYDNLGRPLKTEFYDLGKLMVIYDFEYD